MTCSVSIGPGSAADRQAIAAFRGRLEAVLKGKQQAIGQVLVCLLARGHLLLEDRPGLGKTTLAKALAAAVGGRFTRVQCTPDLLPSDITGFNIYSQKTQEFEFRPGPVFADVLLADEINRATPRCQSALFRPAAVVLIELPLHTRLLVGLKRSELRGNQLDRGNKSIVEGRHPHHDFRLAGQQWAKGLEHGAAQATDDFSQGQ